MRRCSELWRSLDVAPPRRPAGHPSARFNPTAALGNELLLRVPSFPSIPLYLSIPRSDHNGGHQASEEASAIVRKNIASP